MEQPTKTAIVNAAKEKFYNKGYKNTTLKEITEAIGVQTPAFTYFFKKKENIITIIYQEYMLKVYGRIVSTMPEITEDSVLIYILVAYKGLRNIFSDVNQFRYLVETGDIPGFYYNTRTYSNKLLWNIIDDYNLNVSESDFADITLMESIGRNEITHRDYLNGICERMNEKKAEEYTRNFIRIAGTISLRLVGLEPKLIENKLALAMSLSEKIDCADIKFLI